MSSDGTPRATSPAPATAATESQPPTAETHTDRDDDEDREASPDTVRQTEPDDARRIYESVDSARSFTIDAQEDEISGQTTRTSRSNLEATSSRRESSPPTASAVASQIANKSKKPPTLRRGSTKRQVPHRGQEFSVDDDPDEIEGEIPLSGAHRPAYGSSSRQESTATVRRKLTHQITPLPTLDSHDEDGLDLTRTRSSEVDPDLEDDDLDDAAGEEAVEDEEEVEDNMSEAESFTLKDRQLAINQTHPFGIRIWKPALYKKNRSVEKTAEQDIHQSPSDSVSNGLWVFNAFWTILFGWWLALVAIFAGLVCFAFKFESSAGEYSRVFFELGSYMFYPFGQFVKLESDENYADEDEGEGRSIGEYERWQRGDLEHGRLMFGPPPSSFGRSIVGRRRSSVDSASENDSLLGRAGRRVRESSVSRTKRRLFGRGQWTLGRVVFFVLFYFLVAPLIFLVSAICWLMVFLIPMGRVTLILLYHLRKHPLALTFHPDANYTRNAESPASILLCTYRAVGTKYWKYTVDGTNIILINLLSLVAFVIFDFFILSVALGLKIWLTSPALLFTLALLSIIPLAYFIGQAVASISAQSSMGMGAAVNAFFSTIVEVYLYCIALNQGKGQLVEGSVIGSIFAGILLLPGLSMCFGAIKRKTQRFNVKSASATSTMLLFAVIAAFGPTLFYKIYGSHELICRTCSSVGGDEPRDCRQCYFRQTPAINDDFYVKAVRPYTWFAAFLLFSSYIVGLLFTLRTHAAVIWTTDVDEKKPLPQTADISPGDTRGPAPNGPIPALGANAQYTPRSSTIRDSQLYKRILAQSLKYAGLPPNAPDGQKDREVSISSQQTTGQPDQDQNKSQLSNNTPHLVPPKSISGSGENNTGSGRNMTVVPGLSEEENVNLVRQVAEMAATAAAVASRDATRSTRRPSLTVHLTNDAGKASKPSTVPGNAAVGEIQAHVPGVEGGHTAVEGGGHDAPNWSRVKSSVILLTATVAYAMVAEILVNTVDVILQSVDIDEKFLGITLFALVPNTTEFLNAISFAMNGNIALSMEIGSAYALQVCLLQIPALVFFSAVHHDHVKDASELINYTFNLIFPQWDMVTVILCVFLLSYMYGEGKSNYFKGSILVMTYLVVVVGFFYSGFTSMDLMGVDPYNTLAMTIGSRLPSAMKKEGISVPRSEL